MNASSELARTSRAEPPIAAPKAANAAPPATIASAISGAPRPVDRDQGAERDEQQQGDDDRGEDPEHDLLDQQPAGPDEARG